MTFSTMSLLLLCIILPIFISAILVFIPIKKYMIARIVTSFILLIISGYMFSQGNVVTYANGAKINKDNTITNFYILKNDTYTEKLQTVGNVTINKVKDKESVLNKNVKVTRNLLSGTNIFIPDTEEQYLLED